MQIISILTNAFSFQNIDISFNIVSNSYCNISKFKLALPRCNTIYLSVTDNCSSFFLYTIKSGTFFRDTW